MSQHVQRGGTNLVGITCALGAAGCWACYILLTQAVGDQLPGLQGLAVSLPVAAVVATVVAGPAVIPALTPQLALAGLGLALLLPVVPFSLEMHALRRLSTAAFGILMCLEPALAVIAGTVVLHQLPRLWSLAGIAFVVAAGIGAERTGARPASKRPSQQHPPPDRSRPTTLTADSAVRWTPVAGDSHRQMTAATTAGQAGLRSPAGLPQPWTSDPAEIKKAVPAGSQGSR